MKTVIIKSREHSQFVNIDREINHILREFDMPNGVCHIFVPHTTAGITINENADPSVVADIQRHLEKVVPWDGDYAHGEGNSAAHIKASMMGFSLHVLVEGGKPALGTWQSIYLCEFDGPRDRKLYVEMLPAKPPIP
jgi:secondary thiamine-phosphate synthase enzyme